MRLEINIIKQIIWITLITLFFYFIFDFFFGKKIIQLNHKKYQNIDYIKPTIKNKKFSYNFQKEIEQIANYGVYEYKICTNKISLRISCDKKEIQNFDYEILIIGDSFTEGVGLSYNETFVHIFETEKKLKIGNLAVSGYSPFMYYNKIVYYEDIINYKNVKEVIVFLDISDNADDYFLNEKKNKTQNKLNKNKDKKKIFSYKNFFRKNLPFTYELLFQIKNYNLPKPRYRYVQNYGKSSWTYDKNFSKYDYKSGTKLNIYYMKKLYDFLKNRNIDLTIAVYPWPNNLIYDQKLSRHVKIWENFCVEKCKNFINFFPIFFENKQKLNLKQSKEIINKYFLKYDMHFNKKGNYKIAEELLKIY